MAVTLIRTLKKESPRIAARTHAFGFAYVTRSHRCVALVSSAVAKLRKKICNLKHYEIEKFVVELTLTQFLYLRTYIVLILCRGTRFVNGNWTCSHREDLERSMRAKSRCLLL